MQSAASSLILLILSFKLSLRRVAKLYVSHYVCDNDESRQKWIWTKTWLVRRDVELQGGNSVFLFYLFYFIFWWTPCRQERYFAVAAVFFDTGTKQMLQCDTIPPPVALQPVLYGPWDEKGTKTDKLTAVCNLLVKAKWKRILLPFYLSVEPCSSFFSYTFQKGLLKRCLPACLALKAVAGSQPGVYLSSLLISFSCTLQ